MREKTVYNLLFAAIIVLSIGSALLARAEDPRSISVTREVPANASLNYLVDGRVVQSMPLRPGAYRITVERLGK